MPVIVALVVLDVTTPSVSRWFDEHDYTTSTVTGLLVLLLTVLLINRVVRVRQLEDRSQVTAAQAAIIAAQAHRAAQAARDAAADGGDRDAAVNETRTFLTMLLISAPVLIDARQSRTFLEDAQRLAALLSAALRTTQDGHPIPDELQARIQQSTDRVRDAVAPLLDRLTAAQRRIVEEAQTVGEQANADADEEADDAAATDTGDPPTSADA